MSESLAFKGSLAAHAGGVTAIATSSENPDMILTASRGEYEQSEVRRRGGRKKGAVDGWTPLLLDL